ncbi:hypothetical protein BGZ83_001964 [Gryganskiella cystojenkinii]|nr:hypothetical protein BGZ83_001964 [Gryganskiella cystojenkinii]
MNLDHKDIHWPSTLDIVHNGNNTGTYYTSTKDTSLRSHRVKKLFGILPTQDIQHQRRPDLYPNSDCPCCEDDLEDNDHVWNCPIQRAAECKVWKDTVDQLPAWSRLEEQRLRRLWAKDREQHQKEQLPFNTPAPSVRMPPMADVWSTLQHIQGIVTRMPPEHRLQPPLQRPPTAAEKTLQRWTTADLYRGISPYSLAQVWEQLFKTKITVAENLAHRFCKALEEGIRQGIWR